VYERDGFAITFWTYYEAQAGREISASAYADALARLHAGMRQIDVPTPHYRDRVQEARELVASPARSPELAEADRSLLLETFSNAMDAIGGRGAEEQILHGEPHPGNIIDTADGPLFIDLETCCRGPVEFDLAHVPEPVSERYSHVDQLLLQECRVLVLAMVAAWRFDPEDQLPNGRQSAEEVLGALLAGPPYPALGRDHRAQMSKRPMPAGAAPATRSRGPLPTLSDGSVLLRPVEPRDLAAIEVGIHDPDVIRWIGPQLPSAQDVVLQDEAYWAKGSPTLAICELDGTFVGKVWVGVDETDPTTGFVGYWLLPTGRGRGLATNAVRLISAWAVRQLGVTNLRLRTAPDNERSQRVAERSGFRRVRPTDDQSRAVTEDGQVVFVLDNQ